MSAPVIGLSVACLIALAGYALAAFLDARSLRDIHDEEVRERRAARG
jgi:hypothetical protein